MFHAYAVSVVVRVWHSIGCLSSCLSVYIFLFLTMTFCLSVCIFVCLPVYPYISLSPRLSRWCMFRCHYPDNRRMDEMHMPAAMLYDLQLDQRTFPSIPLTGLVSRNLLYGISEQWSEIWNWVKYKMQWNVNLVEMWSKMKNVIKNKPEAPRPSFSLGSLIQN